MLIDVYCSSVMHCQHSNPRKIGQIRERVAEVMAFYAPFLLLDALSAAIAGVIRGAGKQNIGAIFNVVAYYGVAFPIGVPLMFAAKLGIKGLWTGMFTGVFLQSSGLMFYLTKMNWKKATAEALMRAGVHRSSTDTGSNLEEELADVGNRSAVITVVEFRALVLRRGLALAGMLFILAAGIITNIVVTNLIR